MAFYVRLRKFFQQNDPHRLYLVKKIVVSFREDEDLIMDRLEQIYKDGGPSKLQPKSSPKGNYSYNDNSSNYSSHSSSHDSSTSNENDEQSIMQGDNDSNENDTSGSSDQPKKSKKKLIMLILLAIVLAAGGYFGYEFFMKDKPKTEETDDNKKGEDETPTEKAEPASVEPVEEQPQPAIVADTLVDSLQNNIDSLNLNAESTEVLESDEESDNE